MLLCPVDFRDFLLDIVFYQRRFDVRGCLMLTGLMIVLKIQVEIFCNVETKFIRIDRLNQTNAYICKGCKGFAFGVLQYRHVSKVR